MWLLVTPVLLVLGFVFRKNVLFLVRAIYSFYYFPFFMVCTRVMTASDMQTLWSSQANWFCQVKLQKLEGSVPVTRDRSVILLGNHRNIADFFIHDIVTENTCNYLSRALVGFVFPFIGFFSYIENRAWYFVRGNKTATIDKFYEWLDSKFKSTDLKRQHLIVYPEGHRNLKKEPLPLKFGMIRYAYLRQMPIQMFMCTGYDQTLDEKSLTAEFGESVVKYCIYKPIYPADYPDEKTFFKEIEQLFYSRFYDTINK